MSAKQELNNLDGHINTRSGLKFSLFDPKPEQINLEDISHGLAYKGHFAGQTPYFFSIAQHCLLTFFLLPEKSAVDLKIASLLHDASEAYIGDIIKPLKIHLPFFEETEKRIQNIIFDKFNLNIGLMDIVKQYDIEAQRIEFDFFYNKIGNLMFMDPERANSIFLKRVTKLLNEYNLQK